MNYTKVNMKQKRKSNINPLFPKRQNVKLQKYVNKVKKCRKQSLFFLSLHPFPALLLLLQISKQFRILNSSQYFKSEFQMYFLVHHSSAVDPVHAETIYECLSNALEHNLKCGNLGVVVFFHQQKRSEGVNSFDAFFGFSDVLHKLAVLNTILSHNFGQVRNGDRRHGERGNGLAVILDDGLGWFSLFFSFWRGFFASSVRGLFSFLLNGNRSGFELNLRLLLDFDFSDREVFGDLHLGRESDFVFEESHGSIFKRKVNYMNYK